MKVWITKYALSAGIEEVFGDQSGDMIVDRSNGYGRYFHTEGRDWHRTKEEALAKAEKMRTERIASLKKQIDKLEKMSFA